MKDYRMPSAYEEVPNETVPSVPLPFAGVTCWATGAVIRMCGCGTDKQPVSACLPVCTDGRHEWASCPTCKKTWDTRTLKEWPNDRISDPAKRRVD